MLRLIVRFTYLFMRLSATKPLDGSPIVLTGERLQRKKRLITRRETCLPTRPRSMSGKTLIESPCSNSRFYAGARFRGDTNPNNECDPLPMTRRAPIMEVRIAGKGETAKWQRPVQDVARPHDDLARWFDDRAATYDGVLAGGAKKGNGANFLAFAVHPSLSQAALCHHCPSRTDLRFLGGIDRTNGVDQREASEDVQRSVTSFLQLSHS